MLGCLLSKFLTPFAWHREGWQHQPACKPFHSLARLCHRAHKHPRPRRRSISLTRARFAQTSSSQYRNRKIQAPRGIILNDSVAKIFSDLFQTAILICALSAIGMRHRRSPGETNLYSVPKRQTRLLVLKKVLACLLPRELDGRGISQNCHFDVNAVPQ